LNALLVEFLESGRWKNVFVQPAAGNAGTALGAAFTPGITAFGSKNARAGGIDAARSPLLGRTNQAGAGKLQAALSYLRPPMNCLRPRCALAIRQIMAWMHGRMEFGPRALGNRSILASPLDPYSTENLNILHQAPRAVPQIRRVGSGGAGRGVFRSRSERALSGNRGPREARRIAEDFRIGFWARLWCASTRFPPAG
jgi:hypothetical protein